MYAFGKRNCILVGTLQLFESGAETEFFSDAETQIRRKSNQFDYFLACLNNR